MFQHGGVVGVLVVGRHGNTQAPAFLLNRLIGEAGVGVGSFQYGGNAELFRRVDRP